MVTAPNSRERTHGITWRTAPRIGGRMGDVCLLTRSFFRPPSVVAESRLEEIPLSNRLEARRHGWWARRHLLGHRWMSLVETNPLSRLGE
jgi:hypothetical protein